MKLLINYADNNFKSAQLFNYESALNTGGFDKASMFGPEDIDPVFRKDNEKILSCYRGGGYWLWKPYFIRKALKEMSGDDYLVYCDAGAHFIHNIEPLIDLLEQSGQDVLAFELPFIEKTYTKRDAFLLMDCDRPEYYDTRQRSATYSLWKKTDLTLKFISEYLNYACDERIITDIDNCLGKPNYPGFIENRHDQSIFSLLTKKYGFRAWRDPSQYGNLAMKEYPDSCYPQILELTRKRDKNMKYYMKKSAKIFDLKKVLGKIRQIK